MQINYTFGYIMSSLLNLKTFLMLRMRPPTFFCIYFKLKFIIDRIKLALVRFLLLTKIYLRINNLYFYKLLNTD